MRRYDLDWLRVGVFALLILYHVGMFFVPWHWHLNNPETYTGLQYPMIFVNQWRLPILFVISGMGTFYALNRRNGLQFTLERLRRLLVPLLVGILLVVPPQVYLERLYEGSFAGGYLEFWSGPFFQGVYPEGNFSWHHLWFLPYLLVFSLVLAPIFLHFKSRPGHPFLRRIKGWISKPGGLYYFIIPLFIFEAFMEPFFPVTHALYNDWFSLANYLFLFLSGFLLIATGEVFWKQVRAYRRKFLSLGILGFTSLLLVANIFDDGIARHFPEALIKVFNLWSWVLALFGYAAEYLNAPSKVLAYCNEAVYPFYILHQTVTLLLAYPLLQQPLPFLPAFLYLSLGTFGLSWMLYEFGIRRWRYIRQLFGLKPKGHIPSGYARFQKSIPARG